MDYRTQITRFCNYQERSHQEVKDKLYSLGVYTDEVNQVMAELIEANLLNEERFARSFARGKFRIKHWGRIRIIQQLRQQHRITEYLIKKALKEIDPNEYFETALKLAARKWELLEKESNPYKKKNLLYRYLMQKGYESGIINEVIESILNSA